MEGLLAGFGAMVLFGALVFALISIAVVTAVLRFVGKAFNAGNYGWGVCALVVIVSSVAGAIVGALAAGIHPALGLLGSLFVHTALVSVLMQTPMIAAFVITLVSQVVLIGLAILLAVVIALMAGGSVSDLTNFSSSTQTHTIQNRDGSVTTYKVTTRGDGSTITESETLSASGSLMSKGTSAGVPSALQNEGQQEGMQAFESEILQKKMDKAEKAAAAATRRSAPRYEYLETLPESLSQKVGLEARITLRDGREHEGTIRSVTAGAVQLEKRISGGKMLFPIKVGTIRHASVREKVEE